MNSSSFNSRQRFQNALRCAPVDRPPVWLMRQAGRCLPEYRELRDKYSFRELIQQPDLATEVTLQPIRRFGFDAAILFSDILVIPEALGQSFTFRDGGGVQMDLQLKTPADFARLQTQGVTERLQYVAHALKQIRHALADQTALLGFAGSPWTLAGFMLEGGSDSRFQKALQLFREDRRSYDLLAEKLTQATIEYLQMQIDCGVDGLQIFDSLGGFLPADDFEAASGRWAREIITALRGQVPIIFFSKGTRSWSALLKTGAQVFGVDHELPIAEAKRHLPASVALQGNLNPALLAEASPEIVAAETTRLLEEMRGRNGYIFNLGHGVPPDARLENLQALVATVKKFS